MAGKGFGISNREVNQRRARKDVHEGNEGVSNWPQTGGGEMEERKEKAEIIQFSTAKSNPNKV